VLRTSAGRIGVPVDEMFDQQQVVMKPLLGHLEKIRAGSGCALLASGAVAVVLDCEKLAECSRT
jgi:two-component system, chemotaxis family, sensor kinase CheA